MPSLLNIPGVDREGILAALFARLAAVPGLVTSGREFRDTPDVGALEQPALFLVDGDETPSYGQAMTPAAWSTDCAAFVYVQGGDVPVSTALNAILTAIDAAMLAQPGEGTTLPGSPTTLGGKCTYCRIASVRKGMGAVGGQTVAIIHFSILVSGNT